MKIELKNLSFNYSGEEKIIDDLNLTINSGEILAIIGHNGSGKSTLAKLITGLLEPTQGDIYYDDEKLTEDNIDKLRRRVGIIFQNPDNQFVGVTVKDDIAFGLENHLVPRAEMLEKINHYAKIVDMEGYLESNPENLSGGQKQRVAIAGVLAMDTDLIIFDESTSMLDPKGTKEINEMIKKLKETTNKTIVMITHNLEEIIIATRVVVLNKGRIVLEGTREEVLNNKEVLEDAGLKLLESLQIINELRDKQYHNKRKIEELLWEYTFLM